VNYADAAQREAGIGSTLPGAATIDAFEDDAGLAAGREQTLVAVVVSNRGDVLVGQAGEYVIPALAGIPAVEGAFAGGDEDLAIRATVTLRMLMGYEARTAGCQTFPSSWETRTLSASPRLPSLRALARRRSLSRLNRSAHPDFSMIFAGEESGGSCREPAGRCQVGIVHAAFQHGVRAGDGS